MTNTSETLAAYTVPGVMTALEESMVVGLPDDVAGLTHVVQGLVIHEQIAPAYGVELSAERRGTVHVRPADRMLGHLMAEDGRPLTVPRAPESRLAGNCRQITVLLVALLRSQGLPARARCGFGGYFGTGWYEDHWVCEYWDVRSERWRLVDAQIDDVQRDIFHPDFDLLDVPRDRFLTAGDAWMRCRSGEQDAQKFGMSQLQESGFWWIAANLLRDTAAICGMEMLPWDSWGAMPRPGEAIDQARVALFDELAELTRTPGTRLRAKYEDDDRIRVPGTVHNDILDRDEAI